MDTQVKISVALTTYNGGKFLREQLDSIFNQTLLPTEVIVCDDASNDNTIHILNEYQSQGLKCYTNSNNLGFVKNFEKAIRFCTGDFIALSDQDDIWMPNKLEVLMQNLNENSLICSDAIVINGQNDVINKSNVRFQGILPDMENNFLNIVFRNYVTGCTVLFKKELSNHIFPINNFRYHDHWIGIIASKQTGVKFIDEPLIRYRQHNYNDTGSVKKPSLLNKSSKKNKKAKRAESYQSLIDEYEEILNRIELASFERRIINDAKEFYQNRLFHKNKLEIFISGWRNRNYFFPYYRKDLTKLFACLGASFI